MMKRIMVIGCPGSGKSTFSRKLHKLTDIPLYYLDMMYWNTDKTAVEESVFRDRLAKVIAEESWIIDGNYTSTLEIRMEVCDTVIFLDYPLEVCLDGIAMRRGKPRSDMPWIENNEIDEEFLNFVKNYQHESKPKVILLLQKYQNKKIVIFKERKDADEFLDQCR